MLVIDEFVRQRVELLDQFADKPHALDPVSHFDRLRHLHATLFLLHLFYVAHKLACFSDHFIHALLLPVPVGIVHQFEENVKNTALNLLPVTKRVQEVPKLHQEFFFTTGAFFFFQVLHRHWLKLATRSLLCFLLLIEQLLEYSENDQDLSDLFDRVKSTAIVINILKYCLNVSH